MINLIPGKVDASRSNQKYRRIEGVDIYHCATEMAKPRFLWRCRFKRLASSDVTDGRSMLCDARLPQEPAANGRSEICLWHRPRSEAGSGGGAACPPCT
ncbi:hypothetical protein chiPu_0026174 [Chiloscyllium punctatum]|uniref:Uncharacterized protein n=1 Tax=Chiloscyllium punctatum TaxID=137246 RepID=A0A401THI8_CHIPU|nr:hypothetical protein [Chiloscyllium punctatum]